MKLRKVLAVTLVAAMTMSMAACGGSNNTAGNGGTTDNNSAAADNSTDASNDVAATESGDASTSADGSLSYADIKLGEDYTDLTATISLFNHRTDLESDDYNGTTWKEYLAAFNEMYPNITVELTTDTNYADDALMHLQSGDYETVMMIPAVDKADLSNYFISYGDLDTMKTQINYATTWEYGGQVYGVPSTATTQGIVYNKKVFEEAGVTELPKTPEEFIGALQKIKDNTDAIPLYTNFAADWTMCAWDAYIDGNATGDPAYSHEGRTKGLNPFSDNGDETGPYAVYNTLYTAVKDGLTEEDPTTTDWEGSKGRMNNGEIGCMVLGSWAIPHIQSAGENSDDIAYMPFPITVNGKQYAAAGSDYCYGINVNSSEDNQIAAMCYIKWLVEKSGYAESEGGISVDKDAQLPEALSSFADVELIINDPAPEGEETLANDINNNSELGINVSGYIPKEIVENAITPNGMTMDEMVQEWNEKWTAAQEEAGVTPQKYDYESK